MTAPAFLAHLRHSMALGAEDDEIPVSEEDRMPILASANQQFSWTLKGGYWEGGLSLFRPLLGLILRLSWAYPGIAPPPP